MVTDTPIAAPMLRSQREQRRALGAQRRRQRGERQHLQRREHQPQPGALDDDRR